MKSKLSVDIRRKGGHSLFLRTGPGMFYLRDLHQDRDHEFRAPPFVKGPSREAVLAFPASWLDDRRSFQGVRKTYRRFFNELVRSKVLTHVARTEAEQSNEYKQIVTYAAITRKGRVLCFKRGSYTAVAEFLRGAHCMGFGGHVTMEDHQPLFPSADMGIHDSLLRELAEEIKLPAEDVRRLESGEGLSCIGLLNDDSSSVGKRHFAIVFHYEVSSSRDWNRPTRGEKSITQLRWISAGQPTRIWDFEYWSQLCLQAFFPKVVRAASDFHIRRSKPFVMPHVLCVLGEVGSGKTEVTRLLTSRFGYQEINSGRILAALLNIPPVPYTPRAEFQAKAWAFISSPNGPNQLAAAIVARANELGGHRLLIDGIRQARTLDEVKRQLGRRPLPIVYVHTLPHIAMQFYQSRQRSRISASDFFAIRTAPVESEVALLIKQSDAIVYNWTGRARLHTAVRRLMKAVGVDSVARRT